MFVHIGCRNVRWTRHSFWAIQIMYIPFNTSHTWTHLMEKIWEIVDFKKHLWYLNTFERKDLAFQNSCLDQFEDTSACIHYGAFLTKFILYILLFPLVHFIWCILLFPRVHYFTQLLCHARSRSYLQKMADDSLRFSFHNFTPTGMPNI